MNTLLTIILSSFFVANSIAQKVRLEGDNSNYLCLNDSVIQTFESSLQKGNIDGIISILYDYDNGRLQTSKTAIIWSHGNQTRIRTVQGCDSLMKDTTYAFDAFHLWQYIYNTTFESVSVPIRSKKYQSHDKFYQIRVRTPKKSFFIVVRDFERNSKEKSAQLDTRVVLANKIDDLLK